MTCEAWTQALGVTVHNARLAPAGVSVGSGAGAATRAEGARAAAAGGQHAQLLSLGGEALPCGCELGVPFHVLGAVLRMHLGELGITLRERRHEPPPVIHMARSFTPPRAGSRADRASGEPVRDASLHLEQHQMDLQRKQMDLEHKNTHIQLLKAQKQQKKADAEALQNNTDAIERVA